MIGCSWPLQKVRTLSGKSCRPDPLSIVSPHLEVLRKILPNLVYSGNPILDNLTRYYFQQPSKQIQPLLVLLVSQATNGLGKDWQLKLWQSTRSDGGRCQDELDIPFSPPDILTDYNPRFPHYTEKFKDTFVMVHDGSRAQRRPYPSKEQPPPTWLPTAPNPHPSTDILPTQIRLALIVEMFHTASLLHDDVLDASALRRGKPSAPAKFTNKFSVLSGNFMLARAYAAAVRLGNHEVTQIMSSVILNLVEGEMLQMKDVVEAAAGDVKMRLDRTKRSQKHQDMWNTYLQKSYLKSASLMAGGVRSAVVLGGCTEGEVWREIAYAYGRNFGIAFQVTCCTPFWHDVHLRTYSACRWHTRLWINLGYTRKTQQHRPQTWSYDSTSSVCLGGVSGDGSTDNVPIQVSRGSRKGQWFHLPSFPSFCLTCHSFRLESWFHAHLQSHELNNLHKLTLIKQRMSCKSYLPARLETCWKYSQTMLSLKEINLDSVVKRLQNKRSGMHQRIPSFISVVCNAIMMYLVLCLSYFPLSSRNSTMLNSEYQFKVGGWCSNEKESWWRSARFKESLDEMEREREMMVLVH